MTTSRFEKDGHYDIHAAMFVLPTIVSPSFAGW
jgi:hypothetical protein